MADVADVAGGGLHEQQERKHHLTIKSPSVIERLEKIHHELLLSQHDLYTYLKEVQNEPDDIADRYKHDARGHTAFESFLGYMAAEEGHLLSRPTEEDLTYPLSNYFISSSHNTYLTGNQLSSDSSADGYRNVLLRGCRCVEIDVWDGEEQDKEETVKPVGYQAKKEVSLKSRLMNRLRSKSKGRSDSAVDLKNQSAQRTSSSPVRGEPRVLHGYTLTKEISFREVCESIRDAAFVNSDLPVIVSLEVHANLEQQAKMVEIMTTTWRGYLVSLPDTSPAEIEALPPPGELKRKLLIKVKYTAPEKAKRQHEEEETGKTKPKPHEQVEHVESGSSSEEAEQSQAAKPKKKKMLDSLSSLGIYTRGSSFKSFDQPEAKLAAHVFSLSEGAVSEAHLTNGSALFKHNQHFFMRTYPKGTRISSSNLNPALFWRQGVQIVALNWQKCDKGVMLNEAMFAGSGGWVLKPPTYRYDAKLSRQSSPSLLPPAHSDDPSASSSTGTAKLLDITIEFLAAQDIPLPPDVTERSFRPYVKCTLHTETLKSASTPSRARGSLQRRRSSRTDRREDRASKTKQTTVSATSKTLLKGRTQTHRGQSSDLGGERLVFKQVPVDWEALSFLRFKIEDNIELRPDEMAAWACYRLDKINPGLRIVRLFDRDGKLSSGFLLVRVSMAASVEAENNSASALPMR